MVKLSLSTGASLFHAILPGGFGAAPFKYDTLVVSTLVLSPFTCRGILDLPRLLYPIVFVGDLDGDVGLIYVSDWPLTRPLYSTFPLTVEYTLLLTFLDGTTFCTGLLFSSCFSTTPFPFVDWFWYLLGVEWRRGEFGTWDRFGDEVLDRLLLEEAVLYRLGDTLLLYPLTGEWEDFWWMGLWFWECGDESSSGDGWSVRGR